MIAIGAGVVNEDLYAAGGKFNRTTVGGFYTGVGAGGGFIVGGGAAGPLQPLYGMGIDSKYTSYLYLTAPFMSIGIAI